MRVANVLEISERAVEWQFLAPQKCLMVYWRREEVNLILAQRCSTVSIAIARPDHRRPFNPRKFPDDSMLEGS